MSLTAPSRPDSTRQEGSPNKTTSGSRRRFESLAGDRFVYVLALPVVLVLLVLVLVPMLQTALTSVDNGAGPRSYGTFLDGASAGALTMSVGTSLASVLLCGVVGTLLAVLLTRFDFPGRRLLEVVAVLPMALPPLIGAVSFVLLYSETGIVPRALEAVLGVPAATASVGGVAGVLLVHTFTMYPFFYLSVSAGLAGADPSLESAAANLGANRWRVWRTVILPMLTPALVSGSLLTFMISMASFTAPQLYNVRTLTTEIVSSRTAGDYELAAAQSTVLSVVSILFLVSMRWYQGRRVHRSMSKGVQADRTPATGAARWAALVGAVALCALLLAPVLVIVLVSLSVDESWTTQVVPTEYTWDNYVQLVTDPASLLPVSVSVQMSLLATAGAVLIGAAAAWIIARWPGRGRTALDIMIMLPWALPGTVVGVNLITAFDEPRPANLGMVLVGTLWILPVAYFVRYVPLVFRSTGAALDQMSPSLEEAARNLGAGPTRVLRTVTLPLVSRGVVAGALLAFVDGVGEYVASVVIYPAGLAPMSVEIYNRMYSSEFGSAAAYGTVQIVLIFFVLVVSNRLQSGRRGGLAATPAS